MCGNCGYEEITFCSCRNRNCPLCQTIEKEKWIDKRKGDLLNVQYFHVVFTMPKELKMLIKANEVKLYDLMFKCVRETLLLLGRDPKHLGAEIGAMLILHTWNQKLGFHPHIHCLIPGGGLDKNANWVNCKKDFFVPVKVMSKVYRGKFLEYFEKMHNELIYPEDLKYLKSFSKFYDFKTNFYNENWYTYAKETFTHPEAVIEYLGRYTHKIGLTNNRIVKVTNNEVTFSYRDNKNMGEKKQLSLSINEFIRRFLLHILPRGYCKIRYIGILGNRNKNTKLTLCQKLTNYIKKPYSTIEDILIKISKGKIFICPICKSDKFNLLKIDNSNIYCKRE
jgi:hypothetical protein